MNFFLLVIVTVKVVLIAVVSMTMIQPQFFISLQNHRYGGLWVCVTLCGLHRICCAKSSGAGVVVTVAASSAASEHNKADDVVAGYYCRYEDENDKDNGQWFFIVEGGGYC